MFIEEITEYVSGSRVLDREVVELMLRDRLREVMSVLSISESFVEVTDLSEDKDSSEDNDLSEVV